MNTMPRLAYFVPIRNYEVAQHPESPLGDCREYAVACTSCHRETRNICGACNSHCDHSPSTPVPS